MLNHHFCDVIGCSVQQSLDSYLNIAGLTAAATTTSMGSFTKMTTEIMNNKWRCVEMFLSRIWKFIKCGLISSGSNNGYFGSKQMLLLKDLQDLLASHFKEGTAFEHPLVTHGIVICRKYKLLIATAPSDEVQQRKAPGIWSIWWVTCRTVSQGNRVWVLIQVKVNNLAS